MGVPITFPTPEQTQDAPAAVDAAEQQRLALLELEDSETRDLIARWIAVEARVSPAVRAIVQEIIRRREAGDSLTREDVLALQQMAELTAVVNDEFESAIDDLAPTIRAHEQQAVEQGSLAARVMIAAVAIDMGRRARVSVGDIEGEALEEFVFGLQDLNATMRILKGEKFNPIGMITDVVASGAFTGFTPESMFQAFMYEGVTQSLAYFSLVMRDLLATRHRNAMRWVYDNATVGNSLLDPDKLASTDLIRVGRDTLLTRPNGKATADANDRVVIGWRRRSRRDFRVCMVCVSLDGKVYHTDDLLEVHPNERCFMVPILRGMPIPDWETGREWFMRQPEAVQIELMGRGRHELWRDGQIDFDDFVQVTGERDGVPQVKVRALKDMPGVASTRRGAAGTRRAGRRTRANRGADTEAAQGRDATQRPQATRDLEPPFPMADDLTVQTPEPVSALPSNFPTDEQIAAAKRIQLGNTGVNTSYAVEVDGKRYFVKKVGIGQANAEVLNYEIAERIGLNGRVPATRVVQFPDGTTGVIAEFAEGAVPIGGLPYDQQANFWQTLNPDQRDRFQLLEYMNGNTDRHDMNFMINPNTGDFYIIDSGASFGVSPFEKDITHLYEARITNLNAPHAATGVVWFDQMMNIDNLQAVVSQSSEIIGLTATYYSPRTVAAMQARLDLLQKLAELMNSRGVTEASYDLIDSFLSGIKP